MEAAAERYGMSFQEALGCDRQPTHQVMDIQYLIDNRYDNVLKNV